MYCHKNITDEDMKNNDTSLMKFRYRHSFPKMTVEIEENSRFDDNNLTDKLEIEKNRIGEDEKLKQQCLSQLKLWINQNGDIGYLPTDDNFLLRFLRSKKYSLFMTQQMILKYMNLRKKFSYLAPDMDYMKSPIEELLNSGVVFASPFRDSDGRRVILYNIGRFDPRKYINIDFAKMITITFEAVMEDEDTQILGVNHIVNTAGMTAAFSTLFTISEYSRFITWGEQSYPMGHKKIHILHMPSALKYIYDYSITMMSKKLKERFVVHSTESSLLEQIDKKCLPKEMGGIMSMSEMIQKWKEELSRKRESLLRLERINLLSDQGIISRKNIANHMRFAEVQGLPGSFRKLEVD